MIIVRSIIVLTNFFSAFYSSLLFISLEAYGGTTHFEFQCKLAAKIKLQPRFGAVLDDIHDLEASAFGFSFFGQSLKNQSTRELPIAFFLNGDSSLLCQQLRLL